MKRKIRTAFSLVFLAVSLPLLVWGFWPPRRETVTTPLAPSAETPSLPEARTIRLTYSPAMRMGDSQIVELNLAAEEETGDGAAYRAHNVVAEARLELDLAEVRPAESTSTALTEGSAPTFYWEVSPRGEGILRGTAWLYLRFIPKAGGEETRRPVSAQLVEIRSKSMLGRTASEARAWGVVGVVVGLGLGVLSKSRMKGRSCGR